LLGQLRAAAERGVSLAPPPGSDVTIRGWLEAASVAADNARNPTLGATRMASFRARFPAHPALVALSGEPGVGIEEPAAKLEAAPHLALMLPLGGRTPLGRPRRRSATAS
jgi:outer membrane PBP1 activator LpoA protein